MVIIGVVIATLKRSPENGDSLHPEQEQYEHNWDKKSPVILKADGAVSEVTFAVNSDSDFLWTQTFDEEEPTPPEHRWFGIPNVIQGDRIVFKVLPHEGNGEVETEIKIDGMITLPVKLQAQADGTVIVSQQEHRR